MIGIATFEACPHGSSLRLTPIRSGVGNNDLVLVALGLRVEAASFGKMPKPKTAGTFAARCVGRLMVQAGSTLGMRSSVGLFW